jgi:hypothetical protein
MNFLIKYRFFISIGVFLFAVAVAYVLIMYKIPCDADLRYPLVIAILGSGLAISQFLYGNLNNEYIENRRIQFQEEIDRRNHALTIYSDLVDKLDIYLEDLNFLLGSSSVSLEDFAKKFVTSTNSLEQYLTAKLPAQIHGTEKLESLESFVRIIGFMRENLGKQLNSNEVLRKESIAKIRIMVPEFVKFLDGFSNGHGQISILRTKILDSFRKDILNK